MIQKKPMPHNRQGVLHQAPPPALVLPKRIPIVLWLIGLNLSLLSRLPRLKILSLLVHPYLSQSAKLISTVLLELTLTSAPLLTTTLNSPQSITSEAPPNPWSSELCQLLLKASCLSGQPLQQWPSNGNQWVADRSGTQLHSLKWQLIRTLTLFLKQQQTSKEPSTLPTLQPKLNTSFTWLPMSSVQNLVNLLHLWRWWLTKMPFLWAHHLASN